MIRTVLGIIAALGFTLAIAGCGGGGDEYGEAPEKRPEPATKRPAPGPGSAPTADTGAAGGGGGGG
jgi:hypothetical protein